MQIFKILLNWLCHQGDPKQYDKLVTIYLLLMNVTHSVGHILFQNYLYVCVLIQKLPLKHFFFEKLFVNSLEVGGLATFW